MAKEIDSMTMEEVMAATMKETRRVMQLHEEVRRVHEENHQLRLRICKRRAPVPPPVAAPVAVATATPAAAGAAEAPKPAPKKKLAPPTPDSETPKGGSEMVSVFNEYLQVNHAAFPEPTIEKAEGLVKMTLKLNFNGQTYEATATCTNRKICKQVASEKLFEKVVPDVDIHASLQPVKDKILEKRSRLKMVRAEKDRNKRGEKRPWEGAANNAKRVNMGGMGQMGGRGRGGMMGGYNAPSTTNNWQQQQAQQPQLNQLNTFNVGATTGTSAWGSQATTTANTTNWGMMQQQPQQQEPVQQQAKTQTAEEQAAILADARKKGWAWDGSQWVPANQPPAQPTAAPQTSFKMPGATGFGF